MRLIGANMRMSQQGFLMKMSHCLNELSKTILRLRIAYQHPFTRARASV